MKRSFSIVGCGRVGTALARALAGSGYIPRGFASRSLESAERGARLTGCERFSDESQEMTRDADLVFITTPDGKIEETCSKLAENGGFKGVKAVIHCSGALPSTILSSALPEGASIGSLHPLQSFAKVEPGVENPFKGIIFAVEGEREAVEMGEEIAGALEARCFQIKTEAKMLYHAAAVVASNYLVTLEDFSFQLLEAAGIPLEEAFTVLSPLIKGTIANIEKMGTQKALTGPIARGDVETITKHIEALGENKPELLRLYKLLGEYTIPIARNCGLTREKGNELLDILLDKERYPR